MKTQTDDKSERLLALVNQLCEQQLDQAGADELCALVRDDPAACALYVRFLELHAQLQWDLGLPGTSETAFLPDNEDATPCGWDPRALELASAEDLLLQNDFEDLWAGSRRRSTAWAVRTSLLAVAVAGLLIVPWWRHPQLGAPPQEPQTAAVTPNEQATPSIAAGTKTAADETAVEPPPLPDLDWVLSENSTGDAAAAPTADGAPEPPSATADPHQRDRSLWTDREMIARINSRIRANWSDLDLEPAPRADAAKWVRRVYLDLAGRIPTAGETAAFLQQKDPNRQAKLVDHLLASPDFALHWSTRWTNLLVGRTPGPNVDRIALQRFLRTSLETQGRWDLVVRDLISAEGSATEQGATNFLLAHLNNEAVPATAFVARRLLGTQIQCAQCHKHPFYELSQQQFWELNSFFKQARSQTADAGMTPGGMPPVLQDDPSRTGPTFFETRSGVMRVAYPQFAGQAIDPDATGSRRAALAKILTSGAVPEVADAFVNRTWAQLFGYGFTAPVDDMGPHNPPSHPQLLKDLSAAFVAHDYDVKTLIRWICLSEPYQLATIGDETVSADRPEDGFPPAFSRMYYKPLSAEQLYDSLLVLQGEYGPARQEWSDYVDARSEWVNQFVNSLHNDENAELDRFDGSLTQALALMNGELIDETTSVSENPVLAALLKRGMSDVDKFSALCFAVLSRQPQPQELAAFRKLTRPIRDARSPQERELLLASGLEDVMWAYLNSSEFILNH